MNVEMKKKRVAHNITYNEIAKEAGLYPGAVYVVELGHPLADEDKGKVLAALDRLVKQKMGETPTEQGAAARPADHKLKFPTRLQSWQAVEAPHHAGDFGKASGQYYTRHQSYD